MNAKEAREMTNNVIRKEYDVEKIHIEKSVDDMLKHIERSAKDGFSSVLFTPISGCEFRTKLELQKLGFSFFVAKENGLEYTMVCW